ncbi:MAG TPA: hypothetical protein VEC37_18615 [Bacillota bacterium]|nr:hypothetical protein [Bacillota bacterium]
MPNISMTTMAYAIQAVNATIKHYRQLLENCDIVPDEAEIQDLLLQHMKAAEELKQAYYEELRTTDVINYPSYESLISSVYP